jgi:hypothetical protein
MSPAGPYVLLGNEAAKAVAAAGYSNVSVDMLAYAFTEDPANISVDGGLVARYA